MGLWYFELLAIDRFVVLEVNFICETFSSAQVKLVNTDCILVLEENVNVMVFVFTRHLQFGFLFDVGSCELLFQYLWEFLMNFRDYCRY